MINPSSNNFNLFRVHHLPPLDNAKIKSASDIRMFLIKEGVLPSPEEAKAVFWSLGNDWWKQIIDGSQHQYGPLVFDQGLHGGHIEPGYLDSIEKASNHFTSCFDQEISLRLYEEIHQKACHHLHYLISSQSKSGVACKQSEIDDFRTNAGQAAGASIGEKEFLEVDLILNQIKETKQQLFYAMEAIRTKDDPEYLDAEAYADYIAKSGEETERRQKSEEEEIMNFFANFQPVDFNKVAKELSVSAEKEKDDDIISNIVEQLSNKIIYYKLKQTPEELEQKLKDAVKKAKLLIAGLDPIKEYHPEQLMEWLSKGEAEYQDKRTKLAVDAASKLNTHFASLAEKYDVKRLFVSCSDPNYSDCKLTIYYEPAHLTNEPSIDFKVLTSKIIEDFNKQLDQLQKTTYEKIITKKDDFDTIKKNYEEEVLPLIANLFAELDWAHPWIDGQGRTDLILLNGLLCREGLHPCILDNPYFSTSNSLELWLEYLKKGLEKYNRELM